MDKIKRCWIIIVIILIIIGLSIGYFVYKNPTKPKCENPMIKGNISLSNGVKIYHLPGERLYDKTIIDASAGERMFCTEQDAKTAGWRHTEER